MNRLVIISCALLGCDTAPNVADTAAEPTVAGAEPVGPGVPVDHPPVELAPSSHAPERLTVDMLAASLPIIAGDGADGMPITWTLTRGGRQVAALSEEGLARTLGRPDYVQITEEAREPTPLYGKLMDDMARDVCAKMVAADRTRAPGTGTLARFASVAAPSSKSEVQANLRYLLLRFLGQKVADGDVSAVADLEALYDAASIASGAAGEDGAAAGWTAVCVGLLVSPSFHLY